MRGAPRVRGTRLRVDFLFLEVWRDADAPWGGSFEWFNRLTETVSPTGGRN